jgi:hypothetical protein
MKIAKFSRMCAILQSGKGASCTCHDTFRSKGTLILVRDCNTVSNLESVWINGRMCLWVGQDLGYSVNEVCGRVSLLPGIAL